MQMTKKQPTPEQMSVFINTLLFIVGLIGVWVATHSLWGMFFTTIASLHFNLEKLFVNKI